MKTGQRFDNLTHAQIVRAGKFHFRSASSSHFVVEASGPYSQIDRRGQPPYVCKFNHRAVYSPLSEWMGVAHGIASLLAAPLKGLSEPSANVLSTFTRHELKLWTDFVKNGQGLCLY